MSRASSNPPGTCIPYFTYREDDEEFGPSRWSSLAISDNQCRPALTMETEINETKTHGIEILYQGAHLGKHSFGPSPIRIDATTIETTRCQLDGGNLTDGESAGRFQFHEGNCAWKDLEFIVTNRGLHIKPKRRESTLTAEETSTCSLGQLQIPQTPTRFHARELHIHLGSEHVLKDSKSAFPAEMHVVHDSARASTSGESTPTIAVVATWIAVGAQDHPLFERFLQGWEVVAEQRREYCQSSNAFSKKTMQHSFECMATADSARHATTNAIHQEAEHQLPLPLPPPIVYPQDATESTSFGIFSYQGGLTTPPCTEAVHWNIIDTPMIIAAHQLQRLRSLILCHQEKPNTHTSNLPSQYLSNVTITESESACSYTTVASQAGTTSRPIQPLMGRRVVHYRSCFQSESNTLELKVTAHIILVVVVSFSIALAWLRRYRSGAGFTTALARNFSFVKISREVDGGSDEEDEESIKVSRESQMLLDDKNDSVRLRSSCKLAAS